MQGIALAPPWNSISEAFRLANMRLQEAIVWQSQATSLLRQTSAAHKVVVGRNAP